MTDFNQQQEDQRKEDEWVDKKARGAAKVAIGVGLTVGFAALGGLVYGGYKVGRKVTDTILED